MVDTKLEGKSILITGASRGLGACAAKHFADQGALLALVARSKDELEAIKESTRYPSDHIVISKDLTTNNPSIIESVIKQAQVHFNSDIDVVLHCIGGGLGFKDYLISGHELNKLFNLNLVIAARINRIVAQSMMKRKSGNLVHVGSIASSEGVGSVGYNVTKAALAAYVRSLGRELNKHNVICTGILPGGFISPGNSIARMKDKDESGYNDFIIERLPRGIMGIPEELMPMLTLLCSNDASMMGGCLVPIDAGEGKSYIG
jgi:3-oxoacyl-[acyl-carrier protein] reductase